MRQEQNTSELIFDIPTLIETVSSGITIQPGDVIATGTPAGVGIGRQPPLYLKPGDKVEVSIGNLGTLVNEIDSYDAPPPVCPPVRRSIQRFAGAPDAFARDLGRHGRLHVKTSGAESGSVILFVHGLGGSSQNFEPIISKAKLEESHRVVSFDLRGHGLSSLGSTDKLVFEDYAGSIGAVLDWARADKAVIVAHSMGGLVATTFAARSPERVTHLVLIGGVKAFPDAGKKALSDRAAAVRKGGMAAIADTVTAAGTSQKTKSSNTMAIAAVRSSLLNTNPEGYAAACEALAAAVEPDYSKITARTILLAGSEDKTCPEATIKFLHEQIRGSEVFAINDVGHWHQLEDHKAVADATTKFIFSKSMNGSHILS